jgi:hypothetical protein
MSPQLKKSFRQTASAGSGTDSELHSNPFAFFEKFGQKEFQFEGLGLCQRVAPLNQESDGTFT